MGSLRRLPAGQPRDERALSIVRQSRSAAYILLQLLIIGYAGLRRLAFGQTTMPVMALVLMVLVAGLYEAGLHFWLSADDPPSLERRHRIMRRLAVVTGVAILLVFVLSLGLGFTHRYPGGGAGCCVRADLVHNGSPPAARGLSPAGRCCGRVREPTTLVRANCDARVWPATILPNEPKPISSPRSLMLFSDAPRAIIPVHAGVPRLAHPQGRRQAPPPQPQGSTCSSGQAVTCWGWGIEGCDPWCQPPIP